MRGVKTRIEVPCPRGKMIIIIEIAFYDLGRGGIERKKHRAELMKIDKKLGVANLNKKKQFWMNIHSYASFICSLILSNNNIIVGNISFFFLYFQYFYLFFKNIFTFSGILVFFLLFFVIFVFF